MKTFFAAAALVVSLASCISSGSNPSGDPTTSNEAFNYLSGISDAAMRVYGTPAIQKYAPEAMVLLDRPTKVTDAAGNSIELPPDGIVSLEEFRILFSNMTPEKVSWLTIVAIEVIRARKHGGNL